MVQTMSDIINHIADSIEPEDFIDRLGITADDLVERADIDIRQLCKMYREEIEDKLDLFSDVYIEEEEYE